MNLLLDAHTLLWFLTNDAKLSVTAHGHRRPGQCALALAN